MSIRRYHSMAKASNSIISTALPWRSRPPNFIIFTPKVMTKTMASSTLFQNPTRIVSLSFFCSTPQNSTESTDLFPKQQPLSKKVNFLTSLLFGLQWSHKFLFFWIWLLIAQFGITLDVLRWLFASYLFLANGFLIL